MSDGKSRVDFNAPESLVEEADAVAELLDTSRTALLVDALRERLDEIAADRSFRRRLADAYYAGRVGFDAVEAVVGTEEATRMRRLRESLDRDPPAPAADEVDVPAAAEFYEGALPEWTPDEEADDELSTT